jgi:hypothetical protein
LISPQIATMTKARSVHRKEPDYGRHVHAIAPEP